MANPRSTLDHGAAFRVPSPDNARDWSILMRWLGDCGRLIDQGLVEVATPTGAHVAAPGDWIVLSTTGAYLVTIPSTRHLS